MSTLSHEARAMVAAAKGEIVPSPMDRSRVTHALRDRMGAADLPVPTPALSTPGVAAGRVLKLLVVVGALGVVGALSGVAYVRSHHAHTEAPPQTTIVAQPVPDPLQPSTPRQQPALVPELAASPAANDSPVKAEPPQRVSKSSRDTLGEEVQILSRAEKELHNGRPALALKALDEHQRRFASGALVQERSAARIQALCALGRTQEATAESIKLTRTSPNSPQAAQMASPCEPKR